MAMVRYWFLQRAVHPRTRSDPPGRGVGSAAGVGAAGRSLPPPSSPARSRCGEIGLHHRGRRVL